MRFLAPSAMILWVACVGCSSVLGIADPKPAGDGGTPQDGEPPQGDHLKFSVADFKLAQDQIMRLHVLFVHKDGTIEDVTTTAQLATDSQAIAMIGPMIGTAATVNSGVQAGVATISASLAGVATVTVKATVTTIQCHPVINELTTGTLTSADDEFIEIYNPCATLISVEGWTLDYRGKTTVIGKDSTFIITLAGSMNPGELRLYAGPTYTGTAIFIAMWTPSALGKSDGAVGLRDGPADTGGVDTGRLVDSVAYGAVSPGHPFIETAATLAMAYGFSASRLPFDGKDDGADDAQDGDGSTDFMVISTPTPGKLNAP